MRLKYEKVIHRAIVNNLFRWEYTKKSCNAQGSSKYYLFVTASIVEMVVLRFHIYGRGDCMIERPLYLDKIMPFVDTPFVKILTRVRRCGKSIILKMIIKKIKKEKNVDDEQILNYRFDSMEYEDMTTKELYLEIKSKILQSKKAI